MSDRIDSSGLWFLDGLTEEGQSVRRVPILHLPFLIGRLPGPGLTLSSPMISGRHAEFFDDAGVLKLRDLGSTNGTRVNGLRVVDEVAVEEGDIVHFARLEFRLGRTHGEQSTRILRETIAVDIELPEPVVASTRILQEVMRKRSVRTEYQPIVGLEDGGVIGFESLGRGAGPGVPVSSRELFKIAAVLGAEAPLSRMLRAESAESANLLPAEAALFINTHPREIGGAELFDSLSWFRRLIGDRRVVVEIHEAAVTDPTTIRELGAALAELGFELAYDDFGAGQARLVELTDLPPDFLKFDMSIVHDLGSASPERRKLASSLVTMASDLGIATVAEGIETADDAAACRELGFDYAQGFYFGRPRPAEEIAGE